MIEGDRKDHQGTTEPPAHDDSAGGRPGAITSAATTRRSGGGPAARVRRPRIGVLRFAAMAAVAAGAVMVGSLAGSSRPAMASGAGAGGVAGGRGDGPAEGRDHEGFMARRLEKILERLEATDPQKQQLRAIFQRVAPELRAARTERRQVKAAMMRAFAAEPMDRAAIEKLRQDSARVGDRLSAIWARAAVEAGQILTPAQRQKVAEHLARRHHGRRGGGF